MLVRQYDSSGGVISKIVEAAAYLHTKQQTQETNIYALSEIRIRDPNIKAGSDLRLRLHGHQNRPNYYERFQYRFHYLSPVSGIWYTNIYNETQSNELVQVQQTSVPVPSN